MKLSVKAGERDDQMRGYLNFLLERVTEIAVMEIPEEKATKQQFFRNGYFNTR